MSNHNTPTVPGLPFTRPTLVGGPTDAPTLTPAPAPTGRDWFALGAL